MSDQGDGALPEPNAEATEPEGGQPEDNTASEPQEQATEGVVSEEQQHPDTKEQSKDSPEGPVKETTKIPTAEPEVDEGDTPAEDVPDSAAKPEEETDKGEEEKETPTQEEAVESAGVQEENKVDAKQEQKVKETPPDIEEDGPAITVPESSPEPPQDSVGTATDATAEQPEVDPHAPSPESRFDKDATATVKVVLLPSGQVATMRCQLGQPLADLKTHFSSDLKVPVSVILLMFNGKTVDDSLTLGDLGVGPNGTVQLEMQSADPDNTPIRSFKPRQEYHMPDVITVRVQAENGGFNEVVVEIERPMYKKAFMGGYRHKKTGVEYYHAAAQTMQKQRVVSSIQRFCRDTQTVQQQHQVQQTTNNMSTQMTGIGVFVSNMADKLIVPGKYTTADDFKASVLDKVVVIQKYYRRWLAKRYVDNVRSDQDRRAEWEREEELKKKKVPTATLR